MCLSLFWDLCAGVNKDCFILKSNWMLYCCFSEWLPVRSVLNSAELLCPAPASTETEVQQICSAADLVEVKISSRPGEKPAQLCHAADTYLVESRSSFCHCSLKVKPSPSALGKFFQTLSLHTVATYSAIPCPSTTHWPENCQSRLQIFFIRFGSLPLPVAKCHHLVAVWSPGGAKSCTTSHTVWRHIIDTSHYSHI